MYFYEGVMSRTIFKLQKKVIRLISKVGRVTCCRKLLKTFHIIPVPCVYIMEVVFYIKLNVTYLLECKTFFPLNLVLKYVRLP